MKWLLLGSLLLLLLLHDVEAAAFTYKPALHGPKLVPSSMSRWSGEVGDVAPLVLYDDDEMICVYKPPSVLMQDDNKEEQQQLSLFAAVQEYVGKESQLGLVHRLDRPCSGVAVFAKTAKSTTWLSESFRIRSADKEYVCVVNGDNLAGQNGSVDNWLLVTEGKKTLVFDKESNKDVGRRRNIVNGKLQWEGLLSVDKGVKGEKKPQTLVKVKLETGRKHQIRAQMAHMGHPICGDVKYGASLSCRQHGKTYRHYLRFQFFRFSSLKQAPSSFFLSFFSRTYLEPVAPQVRRNASISRTLPSTASACPSCIPPPRRRLSSLPLCQAAGRHVLAPRSYSASTT